VFILVSAAILTKKKNVPSSLKALHSHYGLLDISNVYETKAVGFEGDNFHNLVVGLDTNESPLEISQKLKEIEAMHDRTRGKEQFESRTLDLDQLLYGDLVLQMEGINVPHPDILRYNFVLKPLSELAGDVVHPEEQQTINELWEASLENGEMKLVDFTFHQ